MSANGVPSKRSPKKLVAVINTFHGNNMPMPKTKKLIWTRCFLSDGMPGALYSCLFTSSSDMPVAETSDRAR